MRRYAFLFMGLLSVLVAAYISAEEAGGGAFDASPAPFIITRITVATGDGVRAVAVQAIAGLYVGESLETRNALERRLRDAETSLRGQRTLVDTSVNASFDPRPDGSATDVSVRIEGESRPSLLAVPFYRFDTNRGHNPLAVLYWYNAFGTLTDLGFSAGYSSRDWRTPFAWDVTLRWSGIRVGSLTISTYLRGDFVTEEIADAVGTLLWSATAYRLRASISTSVPVGRVQWVSGLSAAWTVPDAVIADSIGLGAIADNRGLSATQGLAVGQVSWDGTLRTGARGSVSLSAPLVGDGSWSIAASGAGYLPFGPAAVEGRLQASHGFGAAGSGLAGAVRGVADNRLAGVGLLAGAFDVVVPVLVGKRIGTLQVRPFLDAALAWGGPTERDAPSVAVGVGIDLIAFPALVAGFQGRLSVGVNPVDGSFEVSMSDTLPF